MFVQKIIYIRTLFYYGLYVYIQIGLGFLWNVSIILIEPIYIHTMFIVMYWGSGLTDNYPLVSLLLLSTSMEAAQWSNTNTKFRKSRLK